MKKYIILRCIIEMYHKLILEFTGPKTYLILFFLFGLEGHSISITPNL